MKQNREEQNKQGLGELSEGGGEGGRRRCECLIRWKGEERKGLGLKTEDTKREWK